MKSTTDQAVQEARARTLQQTIEDALQGKPSGPPRSPRDFVEQRMRELAAKPGVKRKRRA